MTIIKNSIALELTGTVKLADIPSITEKSPFTSNADMLTINNALSVLNQWPVLLAWWARLINSSIILTLSTPNSLKSKKYKNFSRNSMRNNSKWQKSSEFKSTNSTKKLINKVIVQLRIYKNKSKKDSKISTPKFTKSNAEIEESKKNSHFDFIIH